MKSILKDRKGFTLIELLAVIVILAILVMVAIPAVTRYLNYSRQGTFADNAKSAISAVRNDVILNGYSSDCYYNKTEINKLLERKLETSPFGGEKGAYGDIYIVVDVDDKGTTKYSMCMTDQGGRGFIDDPENASETADYGALEANIDGELVELSNAGSCTAPSGIPQCKTSS